MILKLLNEKVYTYPIPNKPASPKFKDVLEQIRALDAKFVPLRNQSIENLLKIYIDDTDDKEVSAEKFLEWFNEFGGSFLRFIIANYDLVSNDPKETASGIHRIKNETLKDFAVNEPAFADALFSVAKKWGILDENGIEIGSGYAFDAEDLIMVLFYHAMETNVDPKLSDAEFKKLEADILEKQKEYDTKVAELEAENKSAEEIVAELGERPGLDSVLSSTPKTVRKAEDLAVLAKDLEEVANRLGESAECCPECGKCPCECSEKLHEAGEEVEEVETDVAEMPSEESVEVSSESEEIKDPTTPDPVPVTAPVTDREKETTFNLMASDLVNKFWSLIGDVNSILASYDSFVAIASEEDRKAIHEILSQLSDDLTVNVGMLYKVMELASSKVSELIKQGGDKAEETKPE